MTIDRYTVEYGDGRSTDWIGEYDEACEFAQRIEGMVIALHFELVDSELIEDYRNQEEVDPP